MIGPALALIAESNRLGIVLSARDGTIRFRPRHKMTPDLRARLAANKPGILAALAMMEPVAAEPEPDPWPEGRPWWVDDIMDGPEAQESA